MILAQNMTDIFKQVKGKHELIGISLPYVLFSGSPCVRIRKPDDVDSQCAVLETRLKENKYGTRQAHRLP